METKNITIEPLSPEHALAIQQLASDPAIAATTTLPHPYPPDGAIRWIEASERQREAGTDYCFAVRADGDVVGAVSLLKVKDGEGSIGYWIGVPYWGRGYATAAGRLLLDFAFKILGLHLIHGQCLEHNRGSFRVLQKLGFKLIGARESNHPKRLTPERFALFELDHITIGRRVSCKSVVESASSNSFN